MAITNPIIGVFNERASAERAVESLHNLGINDNDISFSSRDSAGGFFGALKNLFSDRGNVSDDLTSMGLSREEAQYYENEYNAGRTILAVDASGRDQEVVTTLRTAGGYNYGHQTAGSDYSTTSATTDYDATRTTGTDYSTANTAYDTTTTTGYQTAGTDYSTTNTASTYSDVDATGERSIPVREEQLNVNKERVQTGEVQLHKEVVSEEQRVNVPVEREEVYIESHSVSPRTSDAPIGTDEDIRVPVSEERVNVDKTTVTTGEVSVGKREVQETETVSDTVRREEVRLDRDGSVDVDTDINRR